MNRPFRWLLSFRGLVWTASLVFALYLVLSPLVYNYWAIHHWTQVPCHISDQFANEGYYFYAFPPGENDANYRATRRDFWSAPGYKEKIFRKEIGDINGTCYVNPKDPLDTVLYVDADSHLSSAGHRGIVAVLILAVAFGVTRWKPGKAGKGGAAEAGR